MLMDNRVTKNHMLPKAIKRLRLPYRQKEDLYSLITISGDLILYKNKIIYFETGLVELEVKGKYIVVSFDVLLLGKNKAILKMPFLQDYNPKINWIMGDIEI